ncbi:response regulator [Caballeronia cordobensis]|uniref:response regulator n=1 Tax=Caballeronia cordobensis TaxID=1353886 RepID=UPI00045F0054|nr:two component regulatory system sensor kinase [Burkholderia sp. RPE67]
MNGPPSPPGLWATRQFGAVDPPIAVLIVDDDAPLSAALSAAFVAYGFRALIADDGAAAFRTPPAWLLHVVILDIEMEGCDGFAVAEAMRGSTRFATVPIIAHTSLAETEVIERGKAVEIDGFYRKGASLAGLFQMIEHVAPSRTA